MNVLIIGGGGREHAIAWQIRNQENTQNVFVAPGNAGTALEPGIENIEIAIDDFKTLIDFAKNNQIDITIVGPEVPLVNGIVDAFEAQGLNCFGPNKQAAQLEGSKQYAKDFLKKYKIPTADYAVFDDKHEALSYLEKNTQYPIVIKADGLAAGKGVVIAMDATQAHETIIDMLDQHCFGEAGARVVIESFLQGEEASFICLVDGLDVQPLVSSQDHKKRDDADLGPNTGGMGAYSPAPVVNQAMYEKIMAQVIHPTLAGLKKEGIHFRGFLYAGLMIADDGSIGVLEFNCRMGDPETQPIMMRLKSNLADHCLAAIKGNLNDQTLQWDIRPAVGVVMASKDYPNTVKTGEIITGLEQLEGLDDIKVFHAGSRLRNYGSDINEVQTNGGRVLCVTALGDDIKEAQAQAYSAVKKITWPACFYRSDIAHRALDKRD